MTNLYKPAVRLIIWKNRPNYFSQPVNLLSMLGSWNKPRIRSRFGIHQFVIVQKLAG